jgi:hypothetical protein
MAALALGPSAALAAAPPQVSESWVTEVTASGATLRARINPEGASTSFRFEYIAEASYAANVSAGRDPFTGALRAPASGEIGVGSGTVAVQVSQHLSGLAPLTVYRYRMRAVNSQGTTFGAQHSLGTQAVAQVFSLLDGRGWEMVSPVDKNGGAIAAVGTFAPRLFQAAADGRSVTYSSIFAFGGSRGAPSTSQYLSSRGGGGWATENLTLPLFSGSYGDEPGVTPYQLFSPDLARGLVLNGKRCRGEEGECLVANPPLAGTAAPPGFVDYYRREANGGFTALLTQAEAGGLRVAPQSFELQLVAASPDLEHVLLSTCAALTADATEAPGGPSSCDATAPNLYEWSLGAGFRLINLLPGEVEGTPGAIVAAQGRAVSADGQRMYWVDSASRNLYVRTSSDSVQVDAAAGGEGEFQTASADGTIAFFTKAGHLYRFALATAGSADLTPGGEVEGVLAASDDGSYVYYKAAGALMQWHGGVTTSIAAAADGINYPPSTGSARVTPDGRHLLFISSASLTGYDSAGAAEVFLYGPPPGGGAATLTCVSCNPTGERPLGPSSIPGAVANGEGSDRIDVYKPRSLSANGNRVFFDSEDGLVIQDTNGKPDAYEWEANGVGTCAEANGCVNLIASGRSNDGSSFVDASADGSDAFFLTGESLVAGDPGTVDLYDARAGGGFPASRPPGVCVGDACQPLPPAPEDPTPGTLVSNPGNPAQPVAKKAKKKRQKKKQGKSRHRAQRGVKR